MVTGIVTLLVLAPGGAANKYIPLIGVGLVQKHLFVLVLQLVPIGHGVLGQLGELPNWLPFNENHTSKSHSLIKVTVLSVGNAASTVPEVMAVAGA